ncbi:MAG: mevalonate pyrophosphate decarboxylase, partial [Thermoplasmataceae archaeon]
MADLKELGGTLRKRLSDDGYWNLPGRADPDPQYDKLFYGGGYPITGIEKFLGYFDSVLNIANFPSISLTADYSSAHCYCRYLNKPGQDLVMLDGKMDQSYTRRSNKALSFFKSLFSLTGSFQFYIERKRNYESAKGLGESAAIAAACARAIYR